MTERRKKRYVDGLFDAYIAFAQITGPMKMGDMTEQTWKLICDTNMKMLELIQLAHKENER